MRRDIRHLLAIITRPQYIPTGYPWSGLLDLLLYLQIGQEPTE